MRVMNDLAVQPQKVPWGLREVLWALGLVLTAVIVVAGAAGLVLAGMQLQDDSRATALVGLAAALPFEGILLGVVALLAVRKYRCPWSTVGFRSPANWDWRLPLVVVLASYAVLLVYAGAMAALGLEQAQPESTLPEDVFNDPLLIALAALATVVAAPLAEEVFFRGFIFAALRDRWGALWGATASGVLFSLAHADPGSVAPFALIGVLLAGAYVIGGSLWYAIAAHFLFNSISLTLAILIT